MSSTAPHLEFAPPRTGGLLRAMLLALAAHIVLLVALTMGVQWKTDPVQQTVEAELWSAVPTEAAPPPPPPPEPVTDPQPKPEVKPVTPPPPDAALKAQADIALAKEKAKLEKEKELKRLEQEKQDKLEKLAKEKLEKEKQEKERQRLAQLEKDKLKKDQAEKDKQDKLKKEQADKAKQDQANAEKARQDNIKRMERLANSSGNGAPSSSGSAAQSSGPSASYGGRIVKAVKPNITYPDNISGNPRTEVEIQLGPTGKVLSTRLTQSSGVASWDDAVIRAIEKTETFPRDTDGSVPSRMVMGFRPKD